MSHGDPPLFSGVLAVPLSEDGIWCIGYCLYVLISVLGLLRRGRGQCGWYSLRD